jgi:REP element-mobilizing transposase RayT
MHERDHLHRLSKVWVKDPLYFLTICAARRRKILALPMPADAIIEAWRAARQRHGWVVGRYVIMPDHVHFFASAQSDAKDLCSFIRDWKKWTTRRILETATCTPPVWQPEFFDHILRSADSYSAKWEYVRLNPVRAGLVFSANDWSYSGECEELSFPL